MKRITFLKYLTAGAAATVAFLAMPWRRSSANKTQSSAVSTYEVKSASRSVPRSDHLL